MKRAFSAWTIGTRYYIPLLALGLAGWLYSIRTGHSYLGALALIPGLFVLYFFRDPPRRITDDPSEIVSPADGLVVEVAELKTTPHYEGPCKRISVFLNIFDVHINRAPDGCTITRMDYRKGTYKNAMTPESSEVNESNTLWLDTPHGPMTLRQIAGLVARRIVCVPEVGERLTKGEKFGMIQFGSRTELYLPPSAEVLVAAKDRVRAGASVVARIE